MSPARTIAQLEYARFKKLASARSGSVMGLVVLLLIITGVIAGREIRSAVTLAMVASYGCIYLSFGQGMGLWMSLMSHERMWFLGYPHSRRTLVTGKWLASLRLAYSTLFIVWALLVIVIAVLLFVSHGTFILPLFVATRIVAWFVLTACSVFAVATLSAFTPMLQFGWWRLVWILIWPALSVWWMPILWLNHGQQFPDFSVTVILEDSALMLCLGILFTVLMLLLGPKILVRIGRQTGANRQYGRPAKGGTQGSSSTIARIKSRKPTPFWAAVWVESTRLRVLSSGVALPTRIVGFCILAIVLVGTFFVTRDTNAMSYGIIMFYHAISLIAMIAFWIQIIRMMQHGYNKWSVSLPIRRSQVVLTRILALYWRYTTGALLLTLATLVGYLAAQVTHSTVGHMSMSMVTTWWHAALLSFLFIFVMVPLLIAAPAFLSRASWSMFITVGIYIIGIQGWNYGFMVALEASHTHYWAVFCTVLLIGAVIDIIAIRFAANHLDRLGRTMNRRKASCGTWPSGGWGAQ